MTGVENDRKNHAAVFELCYCIQGWIWGLSHSGPIHVNAAPKQGCIVIALNF